MVTFRTKYNQGDFSDNESYEPGSSLTEPGQAETMQELMARMTREPYRPVDLSALDDEAVDDLLLDSELDEFEDEGKTGMAEAIDGYNVAIKAGRGSTAGTEAKDEQNEVSSGAKTTTNAHAEGASDGDIAS